MCCSDIVKGSRAGYETIYVCRRTSCDDAQPCPTAMTWRSSLLLAGEDLRLWLHMPRPTSYARTTLACRGSRLRPANHKAAHRAGAQSQIVLQGLVFWRFCHARLGTTAGEIIMRSLSVPCHVKETAAARPAVEKPQLRQGPTALACVRVNLQWPSQGSL